MRTYRIKLEICGNIITPFQADTIFGHLCWVVAHREGDQELSKFLGPFRRGDPPFVISDGFPDDFLPKPLTAEFNLERTEKSKEWKKIEFLSLNDFNSVRKGEKFELQTAEEPIKIFSVSHNTINRLTGTTLAEGGVYNLKELGISELSIYVKATSEEWMEQVVDLFRELSRSGFGKKKSIGKGQFSVKEVSEFDFAQINGANGFVTLSNFCPAENDPVEGFYRTFVKYGKLGEEFTFCGNPFKRPLLMVKTGSVFKTGGEPKEFYGRIVQEGISPPKPEIVQYAYAFAVPMVFPRNP